MCRLMVYHPASKSWLQGSEKASGAAPLLAILCTTHQNSEQNDLVCHRPSKQLRFHGIPCNDNEPSCEWCQSILQSFLCNEDSVALYAKYLVKAREPNYTGLHFKLTLKLLSSRMKLMIGYIIIIVQEI